MDWTTAISLGLAIVANVIALLAIVVPGQREMRRDIRSLSDRVSRIEGFLQGRLLPTQAEAPPHHAAE